MRWQRFLIDLVSSSVGAAAGAATLPAAGPIGAAAAKVVADKSMAALLNEFVEAQNDQLNRIEAINQDMQCRLIRLEQGMNVLLDGPWRTALLHIQEAAHSPDRSDEEIVEARKKLLEAYSLSRNALRSSCVAQELAALYALSGDSGSVRRWLARAYDSGLEELKNQGWQAAEVLKPENNEARTITALEDIRNRALSSYIRIRTIRARPILDIGGDMFATRQGVSLVTFNDERLDDKPIYDKVIFASADTEIARRLVQGLEQLLDDLAQLRLACIVAGIDQSELPPPYHSTYGGVRVRNSDTFAKIELEPSFWIDIIYH